MTTFRARAVIGINGKLLESELNRVDKNKIPTIIANSPLWMHKVYSIGIIAHEDISGGMHPETSLSVRDADDSHTLRSD